MEVVTSIKFNDKSNYSLNPIRDFCVRNKLKLNVFSKNENLKINEEIINTDVPSYKMIEIPDYGRCDYAFLYYIVKNYYSLPEKVLFVKSNYYQHFSIDCALKNNNGQFIFIGSFLKYQVYNEKYDISSWENAGTKLNVNIGNLVEKYEGDTEFLKLVPVEKPKKDKKTLAKQGEGVSKAKPLKKMQTKEETQKTESA